jgi:hypothetical protein
MVDARDSSLRITRQQFLIWQGKFREDSRASECRRALSTTLIAMANVDSEWFREGRFETYGAALAGGVHFDFGFFSFTAWGRFEGTLDAVDSAGREEMVCSLCLEVDVEFEFFESE